MRKLRIIDRFTVTLIVLTLIAISGTASADAKYRRHYFQQIVGSWKLVDDNTGDMFFGTYNGGRYSGTVMFTTPSNSISLTHGMWRRTGPRTFADTDSAFIFDENGVANSIITFRAEIEVNGDSGFFNFEFDIKDLEGNLLDEGASSATGTRIRVERLQSG